jgi:hypothetical protein
MPANRIALPFASARWDAGGHDFTALSRKKFALFPH